MRPRHATTLLVLVMMLASARMADAQGLIGRLLGCDQTANSRRAQTQPYWPTYGQMPSQYQQGNASGFFIAGVRSAPQVQYVPVQTQSACQMAAPMCTQSAGVCSQSVNAGEAPVSLNQVLSLTYLQRDLEQKELMVVGIGRISEEIARSSQTTRAGLEEIEDTLDGILQEMKEGRDEATIQPIPQQQPTTLILPQGAQTKTLPQPLGLMPAKRLQRVMYCPTGTCPNVEPMYAPPITTLKVPDRAGPVVRIKSSLGPYSRVGSGAHIGNRYILSCAHILKLRWAPVVQTSTGKQYKAEVVACDALRDISLLRVTDEAFDAAELNVSSYTPVENDKAQLAGMSTSYQSWPGVVQGYIGADMATRMQGVREGDSGGPVVVRGNIASIICEYMPREKLATGPCSREVVQFLCSLPGVSLIGEK